MNVLPTFWDPNYVVCVRDLSDPIASRTAHTFTEAMVAARELGAAYPDESIDVWNPSNADWSTDYGFCRGIDDDECDAIVYEAGQAQRRARAVRP